MAYPCLGILWILPRASIGVFVHGVPAMARLSRWDAGHAPPFARTDFFGRDALAYCGLPSAMDRTSRK